jgi:hypothetical protein
MRILSSSQVFRALVVYDSKGEVIDGVDEFDTETLEYVRDKDTDGTASAYDIKTTKRVSSKRARRAKAG